MKNMILFALFGMTVIFATLWIRYFYLYLLEEQKIEALELILSKIRTSSIEASLMNFSEPLEASIKSDLVDDDASIPNNIYMLNGLSVYIFGEIDEGGFEIRKPEFK